MSRATLLLMAIFIAVPGFSQYLRTSYFMESATNRIQLNPALRPNRGFIDVPAIGAVTVSAHSNTLGLEDIYDIIDWSNGFERNHKLFERLQENNRFNVNANTDIISFGFYHGRGFWSANIGVRSEVNGSIPGSMMKYARDFFNPREGTTGEYHIRNQFVKANAYTEIGLGYSRIITKRFTLGGKVKMLLGIANLDATIDELYIKERGTYSEIRSSGHLDATMAGVELETRMYEGSDKEYVEKIKIRDYGISGYGAAVDLGFTLKVARGFTLSASVLDVGFISWSKDATQSATAGRDMRIDYNNMYGYITNKDGVFDLDLPGFTLTDPVARTIRLTASAVGGAEYAFWKNKLSIGILSVTRFLDSETQTEITFSGNFRPASWFNLSVSYSTLQNNMQTFGVGFKLGPLFVGTDYMLLENASDVRTVNAYVGMSIPLRKSKYKPR